MVYHVLYYFSCLLLYFCTMFAHLFKRHSSQNCPYTRNVIPGHIWLVELGQSASTNEIITCACISSTHTNFLSVTTESTKQMISFDIIPLILQLLSLLVVVVVYRIFFPCVMHETHAIHHALLHIYGNTNRQCYNNECFYYPLLFISRTCLECILF